MHYKLVLSYTLQLNLDRKSTKRALEDRFQTAYDQAIQLRTVSSTACGTSKQYNNSFGKSNRSREGAVVETVMTIWIIWW